jgi:hypothetical protein
MTWATGPSGPHPTPTPSGEENGDDAVSANVAGRESSPDVPAAMYFPAARNSGGDIIAFGGGLGTDGLQGSLENTAIFSLIRDNL